MGRLPPSFNYRKRKKREIVNIKKSGLFAIIEKLRKRKSGGKKEKVLSFRFVPTKGKKEKKNNLKSIPSRQALGLHSHHDAPDHGVALCGGSYRRRLGLRADRRHVRLELTLKRLKHLLAALASC